MQIVRGPFAEARKCRTQMGASRSLMGRTPGKNAKQNGLWHFKPRTKGQGDSIEEISHHRENRRLQRVFNLVLADLNGTMRERSALTGEGGSEIRVHQLLERNRPLENPYAKKESREVNPKGGHKDG